MFVDARRELARAMLRDLADKGTAVLLRGASLPGGDPDPDGAFVSWVRLGGVSLVVDRSRCLNDSVVALTSHDLSFRPSNLIARDVRVVAPVPDTDLFELREILDDSLVATLTFGHDNDSDTIEVHLHSLDAPRLAAPEPTLDVLAFLVQRT